MPIFLPKEPTAEELSLQKHYQKLKKLKKQLQELKATKKQDPQFTAAASQGTKRSHPESAEEAMEQAKKLLKAGAIKLEAESKEKKFKRSAKKGKDSSERIAPMAFQPFVSSSESSENFHGSRPKVKNLYESFVSSHSSFGGGGDPASSLPAATFDKTVYVSGSGLTEAVVRKALSSVGQIANLTMEGKSRAFVVFESSHIANEAIERLHGTLFMDIRLTVEIARRQPEAAQRGDGQQQQQSAADRGASLWANLATKRSKNGSQSETEKRDLVTYEDDDLF